MSLDPAKRQRVQEVFEQFLRDGARRIRGLRIEDLNINPFLIRILAKQLDLGNSESIVRWLVSQRLERSIVTSLGIALQNAAKVFSDGRGVEDGDILKTRQAAVTTCKSKVVLMPSRKAQVCASHSYHPPLRDATAARSLCSPRVTVASSKSASLNSMWSKKVAPIQ